MILFIDKLINKILLVLIIFALFLASYSLYDSYQIYDASKISEEIKLYSPNDIKINNKNIIGWIKIDNTIIDYPILQGKNNIDYLTLNYNNEYSSSGSIFLDYRNNKNFEDDFSIIYGHNMSYNAMFSELKYYKDREYLNSHNKGKLYLKNSSYDINIILYKEVNASDEIPYNLYLYKKNKNKIILKSLMNKNKIKDKLLLLSTCKKGQKNKRVILLCELNKI